MIAASMEEQCGFIWCMERGTVVGAGTIAIGELEGRGHAVIAIDLPAARGRPDSTRAEITLQKYVDAVCDAAEEAD